ncbi:MAG: TIGR03663 family protein [Verrucomicrobia bacterium]|nr:TIGR03663 family protein [Verrucomicrobiota bacterium]
MVFLSLALLALAARLPRLGERPMHTDEAVNAYITGQLLAGETYRYDNEDRHGPALYALALPLARLAGAHNLAALNENTVRHGPVIVGALTILLFAFAANETGLLAALVAALLWAFAPLPLFYSRYFIHETLFVAATFGLLLSGWRWLNAGSAVAAALAGLCAALMLACKETAVLNFAAAAVALLWWRIEAGKDSDRKPFCWRCLALAATAFLIPLVLLYTWGGQNWSGLADLFRAGSYAVARAGGEGHAKPAWYYLQLLAHGWFGPSFLALALLGGVRAAKNPGAMRLTLVFGITLLAIYSAIPYKTPWLALNFWLPLALLAGVGAAEIWRRAKTPAARGVVVLGAVALLGLGMHDTRRWCFQLPGDERNPYAYAHTGEDIVRLPERLQQIAKPNSLIAVVAADAWPLPWYLRKFSHVGYWQPNQNPGAADFYITSSEFSGAPPPQVNGWRPELFGLRPGVLLVLWTPPETKSLLENSRVILHGAGSSVNPHAGSVRYGVAQASLPAGSGGILPPVPNFPTVSEP